LESVGVHWRCIGELKSRAERCTSREKEVGMREDRAQLENSMHMHEQICDRMCKLSEN